jgi:predicted dehydrogenase
VIAPSYAKTFAPHPELEIVGATDLSAERASGFVAEFGGRVYPTLDDVLADEAVDAVLNLTVHHAHAAVVRACLEAGKHVHTEKPLALRYDEARELVELAERRDVRLSCAPINFLGEAQQTAWKLVREGRLGRIRLAYADVNWGRIESWHPEPVPFYEVGVLVDVGVYPLTLLTAILGPARRVTAVARTLEPERVTLRGQPFRLGTPDFVVAVVDLEEGPAIRLTATFYGEFLGRQGGVELHGDEGRLHLQSFENFDSPLVLARRGRRYRRVPLVRDGYPGKEWARSLVELDEAIREGRPHRASAAHAAHVVEVMEAIAGSAERGEPVDVRSTFVQPAPMDWAV